MPVVDLEPATTQALDPTSSPRPSRAGTFSNACWTPANSAAVVPAVGAAGAGGVVSVGVVAGAEGTADAAGVEPGVHSSPDRIGGWAATA